MKHGTYFLGPPPQTPELEKERKAREEGGSQEIGNFLEWYRDEGDRVSKLPVARVLSMYFEIDEQKSERERREVLAYVRLHNAQRDIFNELGLGKAD